MNLSRRDLDSGEIEILLLGLSFTPAPKTNLFEFEKDLFSFTRKLRLIYNFSDIEENENDNLITMKSNWCPTTTDNLELENLIRKLNNLSVNNV